jgi:hypothetical protein
MGRSVRSRRCRDYEDGVSCPSHPMAIELINRYISRATPKDTTHHVIVGVQNYKPKDFAAQMNVSLTNGWGIVRTIADLMLKQPEGKYVLVKDPNNVSCAPWSGAKADVTDYYSNL